MAALRTLLDLLRGGLIGVVETIPGVSGGTIALVIGIYDDLIQSAGHLIRGVLGWVRGTIARTDRSEARAHLAAVRWRVVIPALVGMAVALVIAARVVEPIVEEHPVETRALFAGLILASLIVPIRMVGGWRRRDVAYAILAAVVGFAFASIPAADAIQPPLWLVAIAAAIAVCALVMPGVSGSFILLVMGLYAPTLGALNDRDWAYIGVFALGAVVGLGAFIPVLQRLLRTRRNVTLAVMTGLMVGSLRALWPWQDATGSPIAPTGEVWPVVGLIVLGVVIVLGLIAVERAVVGGRQARELEDTVDDTREIPRPAASGR
ncbi:DUF368 domain-containing protein [Salinibacterium sp. ZJ77]|uniref:DUF368 domain-containing protein n=1 Tax=Salinibacterium sp. ZJ77 TaxID=2708337 RepID=UPI00142329C2|nr:DUF368 domain-containing protein [Salinibacterium sp. ZJ77]